MANAIDRMKAAGAPGPLTLAIDIGGSRLKCGVLDSGGAFVAGPLRVNTPVPATPDAVVQALVGMAQALGTFDRVSIGFPGVVRGGQVLTAPNLGTDLWHGHHLAAVLAERLDKPVRLLNDASVQGFGVIAGQGLECVVTLGTGFGFALFLDGRLAPHLEIGQHPVRKEMTYDQYLGNAAYRKVGRKKWNKRLRRAIGILETLVTYDLLYLGGGNTKFIDFALPPSARLVSNQAGITGGVRLWEGPAGQEAPAIAPNRTSDAVAFAPG